MMLAPVINEPQTRIGKLEALRAGTLVNVT